MNTNTYIDLLRHGETVGGTRFRGSTDDPLTAFGWEQLWATTDKNESCWNRIITSPLGRCADFAESLGQKHSTPVTRDERFQEMHFGKWEGRSVDELMKTDIDGLTNFWNDPVCNTPPQAESLTDFERRVLAGWRDITSKYLGENILLVTHGGVIRLLICHILQRPLQRILEVEVKHAAIHGIRIEHAQQYKNTTILETET